MPSIFCELHDVCRKVIRRPFRGVTTRWNSDHDEVRGTNIFMGDLQRSLVIMLGEKGCDVKLLHDPNTDEPVDKMSLMFSPADQMVLRQYECASEPVVLLSKFFQLNVPTSHLVLVHLRARIAEMREPKFDMFADISKSKMEILTNRNKTETVLSHDDVLDTDDHELVVPMEPCIAHFRLLFADDLEIRCGLVKETEQRGIVEDAKELPSDIAVSCLLNPLVGGKNLSSGSLLLYVLHSLLELTLRFLA
jgi:hypothetical protein